MSRFPNMSEAFWDWDGEVQLSVVQKTIVDGDVAERDVADITFRGILEPMIAQKVIVKPEGQRQFKYWTLWTTKYLILDSIIKDTYGNNYRIMSRPDWDQAGFYEYELIEAPVDGIA
jgi:hypothetical protein